MRSETNEEVLLRQRKVIQSGLISAFQEIRDALAILGVEDPAREAALKEAEAIARAYGGSTAGMVAARIIADSIAALLAKPTEPKP